MPINLSKGQKVDLTKGNEGLSKVIIGLGWDEAAKSKGGLLGGLFGSSGPRSWWIWPASPRSMTALSWW